MIRNNLLVLLTASVLLTGLYGFSQPDPSGDRVKAIKIAFITEKLELSSGEAQKFWPVFNQFEEQLLELGRQEREIVQSIPSTGITDQDSRRKMNQLSDLKKQRCALELEFMDEVRKVLPDSKVLKLAMAQEEFKRELLQRIRQGRGIRRRN